MVLLLFPILGIGGFTSYNLDFLGRHALSPVVWSASRPLNRPHTIKRASFRRKEIQRDDILRFGIVRGEDKVRKGMTYEVAVAPSILNTGSLTTKVQTSSHDLYIDRCPYYFVRFCSRKESGERVYGIGWQMAQEGRVTYLDRRLLSDLSL